MLDAGDGQRKWRLDTTEGRLLRPIVGERRRKLREFTQCEEIPLHARR